MIEIIPAIDIYQGKCVRLVRGDYQQMTVYHERPADLSRQFEAHGIRRVHLVDLEGASIRRIANLDVCLLYTSPSPRDGLLSRMPSSA